MAGTIPLSLTQQFDQFGQPLSGGLLYIIQAGTVATPQNPYQDAALTILQPNPIVLDAAGRIPQFFLADGYIKVRLTDKNGVTQLARDGILVIGPSAGGGGGGASVDPTTIFQTGQIAFFYSIGSVAGYVRLNGRTIGNGVSGASERANADTQALFVFLYNADANLVVSGGRTGNPVNDYNAGKTIALPDWRGRALAGLDGMGNSLAGRLTSSANGFGVAADTLGAAGGAESNTLDVTRIPSHQHDVFLKENPHTHTTTPASSSVLSSAGGSFTWAGGGFGTAVLSLVSALTGITIGSVSGTANDNKVAATGGGLPHANMPPTMLATFHIHL